jgi:hypothetical protein
MKLVIDIDEKLYDYMQTEVYDRHLDKRFDYQIRFAVKKGEPLPKGHGDLIDRSDLLYRSNLLCISEYYGEGERVYVPYYEIENAKPIIKADKEK